MMTIALLASKLVMSFEGCKLTAYWDKWGKKWTVGFGHTRDVTEGMTITMDEAVVFMAQDDAPLIELVQDRPLLEAAALVSFGHNCGIGALNRVLSGEITIVNEEFFSGDSHYGESAGGQVLPGLVARRELEAALIETSRNSKEAV